MIQPSSFMPAAWALLCLAASPAALATPAAELPAITVTADKQERTLEDVPGSLSVFDGDTLEAQGIQNVESLQTITPGLSFQPFGQAGVNSPVMRGLSANFFSFSTSTLLVVDGVPTLTAQGYDDPLLAIDRVEVLRGPQSTLYGRNAEAGVINVYTRQPDNTLRGQVSAEVGSRDLRVMRFDLSGPVIEDRLYASVAGAWRSQNGFIDNTYTGRREDDRELRNGKIALRWTPSTRTDATLRYAQADYRDGAARWGAPAAPRDTVASGTPSWNRSIGRSASLAVRHDFDSGLRLSSVTAWNDFRDRVQQDTDFQPADLLHIQRDHQLRNLSQELRLEGDWKRAHWLVGLYADSDDHDLRNTQKMPRGLTESIVNLRGDSTAAFTHWTVPLAERWTIEAGARVERDRIRFRPEGNSPRRADWTRTTPRIALQYAFAPRQQVYASASDGFRAGGFNVFSPAANYAPYQPETLRAYEVGAKGWLPGTRLRYSSAVYVMTVKNMQVQQMPLPGLVYVTNAASARSVGAEFELEYLLGDGWSMQAGLGLNRTRFSRFMDGAADYRGNQNPFAPRVNGYVSARYDAPAGWYAQASLTGTGRVYLDAANRYARNGYGLVNLAAGVTVQQVEITAYVNNLANRRYDAVGYQNGIVTVYSPPREAGVRFTWRI
ncbi:iron complex outermembrane receptor protein [Achromobacter deleyi]|uniref:TonB-dependent receptor n=1 Tax=Achromobacter deleyi TaxID=1353891 RepID=UPI0028627120|nr:TonB-dependent receptor [Achromobacter deleyi]MDR6600044.1 iron complex outermembrane receptor protein [Achromobacter deleyi]